MREPKKLLSVWTAGESIYRLGKHFFFFLPFANFNLENVLIVGKKIIIVMYI